ncbi:uncharacterized protein LOC102702648 [Oryza brachyantha]|uniref:uncharacterized protein LOC102702648 n=1 Tax=Oryza brachyantha TaxID=4533 RepID=UPI0007761FE4|nr:uncharacterized protein LOC102702648 [Oryza brachyantha]
MRKPKQRTPSSAADTVAGGPIDAEWQYFLDNVREERGSYSVLAPADGANPSYYLQYEKPRDGSRPPTKAGASTSSPGQGGCKRRRMEEDESSCREPALHCADPNIEEDYREFLDNIRVVGKDDFVLELGDEVIRYGGDAVDHQGSSEASVMGKEAAVTSSDEPLVRAPETNRTGRRAPRDKVAGMADNGREGRDVEEDGKAEDQRKKEKKGKKVVAVTCKGEGGAMAAEEVEKKPKKAVAFHSKGEDSTMAAENLKDKKNSGKKEVVVPADMGKVIKVEEEEGHEQLQILPAVEKRWATSSLPNSGHCHESEPHIASASASGPHGVIWPTHINDRAESDFKQRLIHVLNKPFSQGEYDKLFGMATIRNPLTKERRTRCGVKYYYSQHERGKSYFDSYPDLGKKVKEANYPNRLALLRGFFFWLENVGQEDQFRPWRVDHKRYKIMPL